MKKLRDNNKDKIYFLDVVLNLIILKKMSDLKWLHKVLESNHVKELFNFKMIKDFLPPKLFTEMVDTISQYDFSKLTDFEFADFHNMLVDDDIQKERGQVFTKQWIVDYIIDRLEIDSNMKILEPSVGFGNFVSGLIRKVDKLDLDKLTLYDIDSIALKFSSLMVQMKNIEYNGRFSGKPEYIHGNLLNGADDPLYDVVIGNPPYINIYNIPEEEKKYYAKNYFSSCKKYDLYMLFIEKGLRMLKPGGKLGFIISDKILKQPNGEKIRKYILENSKILEITDLTDIKVFESKTVSNVLVFLQKESDMSKLKKHKICIRRLKINETGSAEIVSDNWKAQGDFIGEGYKFNIDINEEREKVLNRIEEQSVRLGDFCYVNWGTRSVPAKDFHLREALDMDSRKLIKGENINKFNISYTGKWLNYKPEKMYNPLFPEMFEVPKMIFCEVTGKEGIIAACDHEGYFTDHSLSVCVPVHHLQNLPKNHRFYKKIDFSEIEISRKTPVEYLLALVNSKLMFFYFSTKLSSKLNVYPNHVKALPIKITSELKVEKIKNISNKLIANMNHISRFEKNNLYYMEWDNIENRNLFGESLFDVQLIKDKPLKKAIQFKYSNDELFFGTLLKIRPKEWIPGIFTKLLVKDALLSYFATFDKNCYSSEHFVDFIKKYNFKIPLDVKNIDSDLQKSSKRCQSLKLKSNELYKRLNDDIYSIYGLSNDDIKVIDKFYNEFQLTKKSKLKHFTL